MGDNLLRHLVPADYFRALAASEPYLPSQFRADGFIHCTQEPEVLREVANRYYRDTPGEFLVLVIDPAKVRAEVRFEAPINPDGSVDPPAGKLIFPHIYGPLNRDAIVEIHPVRRASDGTFIEV